MSAERSSSAVRNLRSLFENKASSAGSPTARGRSPGQPSSTDPDPPRSKVRASFVSVGPPPNMSTEIESTSQRKREDSMEHRRESFHGGRSGSALSDHLQSAHDEQERRNANSSVADAIPESVVESVDATPLFEPGQAQLAAKLLQATKAAEVDTLEQASEQMDKPAEKTDKPAENPDKPVTGAEEEPASMKPADPSSEEAVSGGASLPPVAEDLRPKNEPQVEEKKATDKEAASAKTATSKSKANKPAAISTQDSVKASSSAAKSPLSLPKTPKSSTAPRPSIGKKASRSSLTAPTASSVARAAAADKHTLPTAKEPSVPPKPKPRDVTKPANVSSHLTAPTAASRAKHEAAAPAPPVPVNGRASVASRPKPAPSTRSTPRNSLAARPDSRNSQAPAKRAPAPVDGSFLERMTRPTAASSNKVHEKTEAKTPPRQKPAAAPKPKVNGHATKAPKPVANGKKSAATSAASAEEPLVLEGGEEVADVDVPVSENAGGKTAAIEDSLAVADAATPTPEPATNGTHGVQDEQAGLEATPAAIGEGEELR